MEEFSSYGLFGGLLLAGVFLGLLPVILPLIIAPRSQGAKTHETYECGVDTIGSAWTRFDISYYLFALIFVAFEVDVLYILPIAVVFDAAQYAWRDFVELFLFVSVLLLAIIYAWRKGALHWN